MLSALLFVLAAEEWPNLYGPDYAAVAPPSVSIKAFRGDGPKELWRRKIGGGYSAPALADGRLLLFHRQADREIIASLDAATGQPQWEQGYPTTYVDRYGYSGGPRATPTIRGGVVFTLGAEGQCRAWSLSDGQPRWQRNLNADYKVEQGFFGVGASPAWHAGTLIVQAGGKETHAGLVGLDAATGKTKWTAADHGASYATPTVAVVHGQPHVLALTETGLLDVDPRDGKVRWEVPFRSKLQESVNATAPLVSGDLVLVSATYNTGALCLRVKPQGPPEEVWRNKFPDSHFSNLILADGWVFGFAGRHEPDCELFAAELATGKLGWRKHAALGRGQLTRIGDDLLLWGERGVMAAIALDHAAATPRWIGEPGAEKLKHPTWTPPAFADGRMYLRNESTLVCFDVSGK